MLTNASYSLSIVEKRVILMMFAKSKNDTDALQGSLWLHADDYASQYGVTRQAAYSELKEAANQLYARTFTFVEADGEGNKTKYKSRWVQEIGYKPSEASINATFAKRVVPLLMDIKEQFTHYELNNIAGIQHN